MKRVLVHTLVSTGLLAGAAALGHFMANVDTLKVQAKLIQQYSQNKVRDMDRFHIAERSMREKTLFYIHTIENNFLEDGMVVNRDIHGNPIAICDSLLFSSIYYFSLKRLGNPNASARWEAILKSRDGDKWIRHPKCTQYLSRDMFLGVLLALTERPQQAHQVLEESISFIQDNINRVDQGPIYVSFVTPNIWRSISGVTSLLTEDQADSLPVWYATSDWTMYATKPGYEAHLVALSTYIDLIVNHDHSKRGNRLPGFEKVNLYWRTTKLLSIDSKNLFFNYLYLVANESLTAAQRYKLTSDLMSLSAFPDRRLPNNCDRKADYLWQRDSREWSPSQKHCSEFYNGIDFVFMAALLLTGP